MNTIEAIKEIYEQWKEESNDRNCLDECNDQEKKCIFLSDCIIGLTTYDAGLSLEYGKMILDTLNQIYNRTTFEYIENEENYKKYILSCNFIMSWLDWGTSIRGAWFETYGGKIESEDLSNELYNINYEKEYIPLSTEFIDWFIEFLNN